MGETQRDIPAATTRWAPSSRGRLGFSARDRQLYFFPETSECNGRKNGREGEGERATRTWTLDALRAATEPVKVEAMQAIVEVGFGLKSGWCVQEWRARRHLLAFVTRNATAIRRMWPIETPRDSETHAVIGPSDPSLPTETGWISRAGGTESQERLGYHDCGVSKCVLIEDLEFFIGMVPFELDRATEIFVVTVSQSCVC